jgi:hypothetical protein
VRGTDHRDRRRGGVESISFAASAPLFGRAPRTVDHQGSAMKKQSRTDHKLPKLAVRQETVRQLSQLDLGQVAGGDITSTTHLTKILC